MRSLTNSWNANTFPEKDIMIATEFPQFIVCHPVMLSFILSSTLNMEFIVVL